MNITRLVDFKQLEVETENLNRMNNKRRRRNGGEGEGGGKKHKGPYLLFSSEPKLSVNLELQLFATIA